MWETLKNQKPILDDLTAHLFTASLGREILTTWMIFIFKDTIYYPYGASSSEHRETMHSTLMCWEVIKYGKNLGFKNFDMWGALSENPDPNDPWFGFHNFKQKFGPKLIELVGSYDLVINPSLYQGAKIADKLRWTLLKIKASE
jgi:lipid II:glycine glycyltransferase (peptidoglycan interpeptide bridge formation enzyme)